MTEEQTKRIIVVLSPGRCGTSLLMKALGVMGMRLSDNLIPGNYANPEGHFEAEDIVEIQKELLRDLQAHPYMPLPDDWLVNKEAVARARKRLATIIQQQIDTVPTIWGFKDPRTNALLPLWFRIFNQCQITPSFTLSVRKPQTTVASYCKQYNDAPEIAELAYLTRTTDALHHTAADCFIVHYEDWFTRPVEQAQGLLTYTGLDQFFSGNVEDALKDVIKPNLNRAVYEDYEVQNEYVLKLYDVLKDCRGADFDRQRLMAVVKECRKAMDGFKGWHMEARKAIGQLSQARDRLDKERNKAEELAKVKQEERKKAEELARVKQEERRKEQELADSLEKMKQAEERLEILHNSISYRLGHTLVTAVRKPGWKTLRLPFDLAKLFGAALAGRKNPKHAAAKTSSTKSQGKKPASRKNDNSQELETARLKRTDLIRQYEAAMARIAALENSLKDGANPEVATPEITEAVMESNRLLLELKDLEDAILEMRIRCHARSMSPRKNVSDQNRAKICSASGINNGSYQRIRRQVANAVGNFKKKFTLRPPRADRLRRQMRDAWKKPGKNTVLLPIRLVRHVLEVLNDKRKKAMP